MIVWEISVRQMDEGVSALDLLVLSALMDKGGRVEPDVQETDYYNRVPQVSGTTLVLDRFTCDNLTLLSAEGGSGLVYEAASRDYYGTENAAVAQLVVKECYPADEATWLVRDGQALVFSENAPENAREGYAEYLSRFAEAFFVHTSLYQSALREYVTVPSRTCFVNGTAYMVSDATGGVPLSRAIDALSASERLAVLVNTVRFLEGLHAQGWLYLDLKPSNILLAGHDDNAVGWVKFFDFDTVARLGEPVEHAPSSGVWAAYEQTHPESSDKIGPAADVYALGVLAFRLLFGRTPTAAEIIHADGDWQVDPARLAAPFVQAGVGKAACAHIKSLLDATLVCEPERRAQETAVPLQIIGALAGMFEPADPAVAAEFAKLNAGLAEASAAPRKHRGRRIATVVAAVIVVLACGFGVKTALDAASDAAQQAEISEQEAKVLGTWVSVRATQRDNLVSSPWDTEVTFEFFADHTMLWTQDGVTNRYSWAYDQSPTSSYGGGDNTLFSQYIIKADPNVYGLVNFVLYEDLNGACCYICMAGDALEDYRRIRFTTSGSETAACEGAADNALGQYGMGRQ